MTFVRSGASTMTFTFLFSLGPDHGHPLNGPVTPRPPAWRCTFFWVSVRPLLAWSTQPLRIFHWSDNIFIKQPVYLLIHHKRNRPWPEESGACVNFFVYCGLCAFNSAHLLLEYFLILAQHLLWCYLSSTVMVFTGARAQCQASTTFQFNCMSSCLPCPNKLGPHLSQSTKWQRLFLLLAHHLDRSDPYHSNRVSCIWLQLDSDGFHLWPFFPHAQSQCHAASWKCLIFWAVTLALILIFIHFVWPIIRPLPPFSLCSSLTPLVSFGFAETCPNSVPHFATHMALAWTYIAMCLVLLQR